MQNKIVLLFKVYKVQCSTRTLFSVILSKLVKAGVNFQQKKDFLIILDAYMPYTPYTPDKSS